MAIENIFRTQLTSKTTSAEVSKAIRSIMQDPNFVQLKVGDQKLEITTRIYPGQRLALHVIKGVPPEVLSGFC